MEMFIFCAVYSAQTAKNKTKTKTGLHYFLFPPWALGFYQLTDHGYKVKRNFLEPENPAGKH